MSNEISKITHLLGIKQIAGELDYCTDTVRRMFHSGRLPGAFQAGGKGSAIKMTLEAVRRLKGEI